MVYLRHSKVRKSKNVEDAVRGGVKGVNNGNFMIVQYIFYSIQLWQPSPPEQSISHGIKVVQLSGQSALMVQLWILFKGCVS